MREEKPKPTFTFSLEAQMTELKLPLVGLQISRLSCRLPLGMKACWVTLASDSHPNPFHRVCCGENRNIRFRLISCLELYIKRWDKI